MAIASVSFSLISVIVTILAIKTQRGVFANRQSILIQFTVIGLSAKDRHLQTRTMEISRDIADLLKLHHKLVEIEQPRGFAIRVNVYMNNVQYSDVDYESVLRDAVSDGTLSEIIGNNWKLNRVPGIKDFTYTEKQSDAQKENTVLILASRRAPKIVPNHMENDSHDLVEMPSIPRIVETPLERQSSSSDMYSNEDVDEGLTTDGATNRAKTTAGVAGDV